MYGCHLLSGAVPAVFSQHAFTIVKLPPWNPDVEKSHKRIGNHPSFILALWYAVKLKPSTLFTLILSGWLHWINLSTTINYTISYSELFWFVRNYYDWKRENIFFEACATSGFHGCYFLFVMYAVKTPPTRNLNLSVASNCWTNIFLNLGVVFSML